MNESYCTEQFEQELSSLDPRTRGVVELSAKLCSIPGVSVPVSSADHEQIRRAYNVVVNFARDHQLQVIEMEADEEHPFPYAIITFSGLNLEDEKRSLIALVGHVDVVGSKPEDRDRQFSPVIEDRMLKARGSADMKTVVATQLTWMAEQEKMSGTKPPIVLMISCTEENGSVKPYGTKEALQFLRESFRVRIGLAIVGERTGELETMEVKNLAPICVANRGWRWYRAEGSGVKNGYEALFVLSSAVQNGRKSILEMNSVLSSERMKEQASWRSGFVNSFVRIGSDIDTQDMHGIEFVLKKTGKNMHSALVDVSEESFIEHALSFVQKAKEDIGDEQVRIKYVRAGSDHDYNTVSCGGEICLVVRSSQRLIDSWLCENLPEGFEMVRCKPIAFDSKIERQKPVIGLDIREVPEHTVQVNVWIEKIRKAFGCVCIDLETVNDGDAWECPADNPELRNLTSAYKEVSGGQVSLVGKRHGNDGRFFNGDAVVFGQFGINPHGHDEGHMISSVLPYMSVLDELVKTLK